MDARKLQEPEYTIANMEALPEGERAELRIRISDYVSCMKKLSGSGT